MFQNSLKFLSGYGVYSTSQRGSLCQLSDIIDFFFVAHPASGRKEGEEHRRVMFFYTSPGAPPDIPRQTEVTGFAEAITNFINDFTDKEELAIEEEFPYRDVITQKAAHVYIQVERGQFLLGLSLDKKACKDFEYTVFMPTLRTIVIEAYKMFKLFFGPFEDLRRSDEKHFRERLDYFFTRYLAQMRVFNMPLLNFFSGVEFQQLQGSVFLNIETLMSETREAFPCVQKVLFLYQDKVLYYSVAKADLSSIYRYLTENLLPMSLRAELEPLPLASSRTATQTGSKWLTGPTDLQNDLPLAADCMPPTVFLISSDDEETYVEHTLLVYRSLNATVCLFCQGDVTRQLMRNIDGFLGAELGRLASQIGDAWVFVPSVSTHGGELRVSDFHFIYFNPSSLSLRTSFHQSPLVGGGGASVSGSGANDRQLPSVPQPVCRVACEAYERLLEADEDFGECLVKEANDWWIVIKKVNDRVLILLLPPSSNIPTLPEAQTRANDIIKSRFQGIFLL